MENITIRNLQLHEMVIPIELAFRDNRNPGINDPDFLFKSDNNGFFAAIIGTEVYGTISSIKYENNLGFIGLHFVVEHYRNSGLTEKLLEVALNVAGTVDVGINCREDQAGLYQNFGFKPSFKILSYRGIVNGKFEMAAHINSPFMVPFDELYKYYKHIYPYESKMFFYQWINQPNSMLFGKFEDNIYKGTGLFKPCRNGYRLSPLIADDAQSAKEILTSLAAQYEEGTPYYIDIPETNAAGVNMLQELGLEKIGESIRMYNKNEHEISLNNVYSFTNLEVG